MPVDHGVRATAPESMDADTASFADAAREITPEGMTLDEVKLHLDAHPEILNGKGPGGIAERNVWLDAYREKTDARAEERLLKNPDISQAEEDRALGTNFVSAFVNGDATAIYLHKSVVRHDGAPARWGERVEPDTVRLTAPLGEQDLVAILQREHPDCKILAAVEFSPAHVTGKEPIFLTAAVGNETVYFNPWNSQLIGSGPQGVTLGISGRHIDLPVASGTFLRARDVYMGCAPPDRRNLSPKVFGVADLQPHPI